MSGFEVAGCKMPDYAGTDYKMSDFVGIDYNTLILLQLLAKCPTLPGIDCKMPDFTVIDYKIHNFDFAGISNKMSDFVGIGCKIVIWLD